MCVQAACMEFLLTPQQQELLDYMPVVRRNMDAWAVVEVFRVSASDEEITMTGAAALLSEALRAYEGRIYLCNSAELLLVMQSGGEEHKALAEKIKNQLPAGYYEVEVVPETEEGLLGIEMRWAPSAPPQGGPYHRERLARAHNIVLVADDDMYMRELMKRGLADVADVVEVVHGNDVEKVYSQYNPDIVFLDIHMPDLDGRDILHHLLMIDPDAHIVMVSADSSRENVQLTKLKGAKGFLAKPFTRERLLDYVSKCATIRPRLPEV